MDCDDQSAILNDDLKGNKISVNDMFGKQLIDSLHFY